MSINNLVVGYIVVMVYTIIDVLMNIQDSIIALNSNKWKAKKTQNMKLKQQSRNIRSNCAILDNLYIINKERTDSIMAMDVIGKQELDFFYKKKRRERNFMNDWVQELIIFFSLGEIGYLYLLKLKKNVYVATMVGSVFLPSSINELAAFKNTLETLVIWRNFMENQIQTIKNAELSNLTCINCYQFVQR